MVLGNSSCFLYKQISCLIVVYMLTVCCSMVVLARTCFHLLLLQSVHVSVHPVAVGMSVPHVSSLLKFE